MYYGRLHVVTFLGNLFCASKLNFYWNYFSECNILNSEIAAIDWNELDVIQEDYSIANVSTPRAQTPPPATTEVPSAANTYGC